MKEEWHVGVMALERFAERHAAFVACFVQYAALHALRAGYAGVKRRVGVAAALSVTALAALDGAFLALYAAGLFVFGLVGDRYGPSRTLACGCCAAAAAAAGFAVLAAGGAPLFVLLPVWALGGALQGAGWPNAVAIVSAATPPDARGWWCGALNGSVNAGDAAGLLAVSALPLSRWCGVLLALSACVAFASGCVAALPGPTTQPQAAAAPAEEAELEAQPATREAAEEAELEAPLVGLEAHQPGGPGWRAMLTPAVGHCCAAYFCLKLVNYTLLFWLPYFLSATLGPGSDRLAARYSTAFDAGMLAGNVAAGALSDALGGRRATVSVASLALAAAPLAWLPAASGKAAICAALLSAGFLLGGPAGLLSGALAADLGEGAAAPAAVVGLVDAAGSVGAAAGQGLVAVLTPWSRVFYALVVAAAAAALALSPIARRELLEGRRGARGRRTP